MFKPTSEFIPITIVLVFYTAIIYSIAILASKKSKKKSEFILGNRNLSGFVTAMSAGASDMSSWLLMALPGLIYLQGLSSIWLPIFLTIGTYLNWILVAKKLRIYTEKLGNALTIPEYLSNRFGNQGNFLRLVTGLLLIIFFTFYAVAGFVSAAKLTQLTFGFSYKFSLFVSATFIVTYTAIGGFLAVSWVDVFQGLLMFFSLLIVPIVAYNNIDNVMEKAHQILLASPTYFSIFEGVTFLKSISLFAWGLGYVGQPHIISRFMAIRSTAELPKARNICTSWIFIAMICASFVGIVGRLIYQENYLSDPETIFLTLSKAFFNPWANGIFLCAVISSIMSTVSALILMSANSLIEDFYRLFKNKHEISDRKNIWLNRIGIIFIASISILIAANPKLTIMQSVAFPWCGLGAAFGPIIIMSLYWEKTTYYGAITGIISGGGFVILWEILDHYNIISTYGTEPGFCLLPAFIISLICIFLVSSITKKIPKYYK